MPGNFRGHRAFAAFWAFAVRHESEREREMRRYVAGGLSGRVLEIGAGVGTNWQYIPDGVDYTGIEPDPYMRRRAVASDHGDRYKLVDAVAEDLPFPGERFDTVLCTLTLCSVQDPARAVFEMKRVLRPGGELRFFEHIRPNGRLSGPFFDTITPLWKRAGGGCHPNRHTLRRLESAGFTVTGLRHLQQGPVPMVAGVAAKD